MKSTRLATTLALLVSAIFAAGGAIAQSPRASETTNNGASITGSGINAELDTTIDAKKAKSGEAVLAHTTEPMKSTDNRAILPKGTKLTGHVTQASSRAAGGTETMVAIQFDKAVLKDGQEVPLANFAIQALAAPSSAPSSLAGDNDRISAPSTMPSNNPPSNNPSMSGSRGARPESTPNTQSYPNAEPNSPGAPAAAPNAAGPLPANARGVYGIEGVRLMTAASNIGGSVIVSTGKNLHLDKGTRFLLVGQPQSGTASNQ